jgi:hypothetical protein
MQVLISVKPFQRLEASYNFLLFFRLVIRVKERVLCDSEYPEQFYISKPIVLWNSFSGVLENYVFISFLLKIISNTSNNLNDLPFFLVLFTAVYLVFYGSKSHSWFLLLKYYDCNLLLLSRVGVTVRRGLSWMFGFIALIHSTRNYK